MFKRLWYFWRDEKNSSKYHTLFSQQRNFFHFVFVSSIKRIALFSIFWVNGQKSAVCITADFTLKTKSSCFFIFRNYKALISTNFL